MRLYIAELDMVKSLHEIESLGEHKSAPPTDRVRDVSADGDVLILAGLSGSCVNLVAAALLSRWPKDSAIHQVIADCSEANSHYHQSADDIARSVCTSVLQAVKNSNESLTSRPKLILVLTIPASFSVDLPLFLERCIPPSCRLKCVVSVVSSYSVNRLASAEMNPDVSLEAAFLANNRYAALFISICSLFSDHYVTQIGKGIFCSGCQIYLPRRLLRCCRLR